MAHHCRCRRCATRRALPKPPEQYQIQPACRTCGARDYRIDRWMMRRDTHAQACTCSGYWFWHRQGSRYCWHRKDGSLRLPTDADFADRHLEHYPNLATEPA